MKKLIFAAAMFVASLSGAQTMSGTINLVKCNDSQFNEVDWRFIYNLDAEEPYLTLFTQENSITLQLIEYVGKNTYEWGQSITIKCRYEENGKPTVLVLSDMINGDSCFSFIDSAGTCSFFVGEFYRTKNL